MDNESNSKIEKMKGQPPKIFSAPSAPFYMKITFFGLFTVFVDQFETENPSENPDANNKNSTTDDDNNSKKD